MRKYKIFLSPQSFSVFIVIRFRLFVNYNCRSIQSINLIIYGTIISKIIILLLLCYCYCVTPEFHIFNNFIFVLTTGIYFYCKCVYYYWSKKNESILSDWNFHFLDIYWKFSWNFSVHRTKKKWNSNHVIIYEYIRMDLTHA